MRLLYTLILYLITPLALARLWWRGRKLPAYRQRWRERFGYFTPPAKTPVIWIHAVSVGEFQAALPLIKHLRARHPGLPVVVTTTTPTGSERVQVTFAEQVFHVYAPYDLPGTVSRFLTRIQPKFAVIMETELWPNLFHACGARGIPVVVANARLSARSAAGYMRVARLTRATLADTTLIAAQSQADAQRFIALGAPPARTRVMGNIKFDISVPEGLPKHAQTLRRAWGATRPVWIAASTHAGEEEYALAAHAYVRAQFPDALLVLVPRHPDRFNAVAALCERLGHETCRRSADHPCAVNTSVFLGDTMGELMLFYAASDVAYVGGSLVPTGGHNVLEPAALGIPVVVGPHTFNFAEITPMLIEQGGGVQVRDSDELAQAVVRYLSDASLRQTMGAHGQSLVAQNRGALAALADCLEHEIKETAAF